MYLAYCDDEEAQLAYVKRMAEDWGKKAGKEVRVSLYGSAEELLFEQGEQYPFDLLILDIDMREMDGMTLARKIRERDGKVPILFLTNKREYVFEGYEVGALRYLLKPLTEEKFFPLLEKIEKEKQKETPYLIEMISGEQVKMDIRDILYIEVNGHYLKIHTIKGAYELKKTLTGLQQEIKEAAGEDSFAVTHRSFFVNLLHVERVLRAECMLSDGSRIPISRNAYKQVNEAFIRYYRRKGEVE